MGAVYESAATLGFYGDDLDPDELTQAFGCAPCVGVKRGGIWQTARGAEKTARTGSWRIDSLRIRPGNLDTQIQAILGRLSNDLAIWQHLAARYDGKFFCGIFMRDANEGIALLPITLVAISERGLSLDLDIYGGDGDAT